MTLRAPALALALLLTVAGLASARTTTWQVPGGGDNSFLTPLPGGRVLAATSTAVRAYDGTTGRPLWRRAIPGAPFGFARVPVVGPDRRLYLVGGRGTLVISSATGRTVGRTAALAGAASPDGRGGFVPFRLLGGGKRVAGRVGTLYARVLPPAVARVGHDGEVALAPGVEGGDPAVSGGIAYAEVPGTLGHLLATRVVSSGAPLWSLRAVPWPRFFRPVADRLGPYAAVPDGSDFAVSALTPAGAVRWLADDPLGDGTRSKVYPVLATRGVVILGEPASADLAAREAGGGRLIWRGRGLGDLHTVLASGSRLVVLYGEGRVRSFPFPSR